MFLSVKKYVLILKSLAVLANRPYLQRIVENADGTITFEFVQGDKIYKFIAANSDYVERILN